ncbi:Uma2 family endonuclease [Streptomyces sp. NPDC059008]|uniref:Uma2 family endonuclease n=1 Tax=Streptomyces sp. NPDC059008 TaxID=3346693 RepID=UPI003693AD43
MTDSPDRPYRTLTEYFEEAARILARSDERPRLELIEGRVSSKAGPDGNHGRTVAWLTRLFLRNRPELWLSASQGLKVQSGRDGRACPDGLLAHSGAFAGQGQWVDPEPVLMVVEITSCDPGADHRARVQKPRAYAEAGIPLYLLIEREERRLTLHGEPDASRYEDIRTVAFGETLHLPDPVDITLDTEPLKDWAAAPRRDAAARGRG